MDRYAPFDEAPVDVSIVMPCLDEALCLPPCIAAARACLDDLRARRGLTGEIVIADNGSTDGSAAVALSLGARVEPVAEKGYGAALRGGMTAARGRFLVMGDADGSYDFRQAAALVEALLDGADLAMGSRFKGVIKPGAMPWKNRYFGNPVLTGILNLLFSTRVSDAHCGLRALTRACFDRLNLGGAGMEFASEMVIKAALKGERIVERPVTLSPDLRDRPPHLRPWRDGWRHLRYLFMLSPAWLFALPAVVAAAIGLTVLSVAGLNALLTPGRVIVFGDYWVILAAEMVGLAHLAGILAAATQLHGVRLGYRRPLPWARRFARFATLEAMILAGVVLGALGLGEWIWVVLDWSARHFGPARSVLPAVIGALMVTLGMQTILGGFFLSIVNGHTTRFVEPPTTTASERAYDPGADTWRTGAPAAPQRSFDS
jgi:glycosyltransferase involved in cell wall biosynthesis